MEASGDLVDAGSTVESGLFRHLDNTEWLRVWVAVPSLCAHRFSGLACVKTRTIDPNIYTVIHRDKFVTV